MKKTAILLIGFLFPLFTVPLKAEPPPVLKIVSLTPEVAGNKVKITMETNQPVIITTYAVKTPTQIIVDPIGTIFSNLPDISPVGKGFVRQIRVVKAAEKTEEGLDSSYYALDFIIVE